jgi:hypothetical protein
MKFKVVGSRRVAHVAPGGEVSEQQITAAGGSVSHLIASGHIAPVVKARKAASTTIPVDEAENEETE